MDTRIATAADLDGLTATLTAAFERDPLWGSWAFPDAEDLAVWWRFYLRSALRYRCVWVRSDYAAASVWIPPGGSELTEEEEGRVEPLLEQLVGSRAPEIMELVKRFEATHPQEPPHFYLTLLGTHPNYRGRGLGLGLLAENLASLGDTEGVPSYLESTNPSNNPRYERLGFRRVGEFTTPDGKRTVTTMWRDAERPRAAAISEYSDAVLALYDPEVEVDMSHAPCRDLVGKRFYHGHDGLRAFYREWNGAWETSSPMWRN